MPRNNADFQGAAPHLYAGGTLARRRPANMTPAEIVANYRAGDLPGSKEEQDTKGSAPGGTHWLLKDNLIGSVNGKGASGGSTGGSLFESIGKSGYDTSRPIVLNPDHPDGPTIVDGHHRLAVMHATAPHTPIPVMFTNDLQYNQRKPLGEAAAKKLMPTKPNFIAGNCKACGQKVGEQEGVIVKVQGKGNPFHLYHPEHLTAEQHALYPKRRKK